MRPENHPQRKKNRIKARQLDVIYTKIGRAPIVMIAKSVTLYLTLLLAYCHETVALLVVALLHRVTITASWKTTALKRWIEWLQDSIWNRSGLVRAKKNSCVTIASKNAPKIFWIMIWERWRLRIPIRCDLIRIPSSALRVLKHRQRKSKRRVWKCRRVARSIPYLPSKFRIHRESQEQSMAASRI